MKKTLFSNGQHFTLCRLESLSVYKLKSVVLGKPFQIRCKVCFLILDMKRHLKSTKGRWYTSLRFKSLGEIFLKGKAKFRNHCLNCSLYCA